MKAAAASLPRVALCLCVCLCLWVAICSGTTDIDTDTDTAAATGTTAAPRGVDLVSIAGWPQSGTSLLQQLLTVAPATDTMVELCFKAHGKRCTSFNNEGQWLLDNGAKRRMLDGTYAPGRSCEPPPGAEDRAGAHIVAQWFSYWHNNSKIVVQKSPQDLLKLSFLDNIFKPMTANRRFIVVLKHPATLSTALPKRQDWTHARVGDGKTSEKKYVALTKEQVNDNFLYFHRMMTKEIVAVAGKSPPPPRVGPAGDSGRPPPYARCDDQAADLGWLPALEAFAAQMERNPELRKRTKIVRFEQLVLDPLGTCRALLAFALGAAGAAGGEALLHNQAKICSVHFRNDQPPPVPKRPVGSGRSKIKGLAGTENIHLGRSSKRHLATASSNSNSSNTYSSSSSSSHCSHSSSSSSSSSSNSINSTDHFARHLRLRKTKEDTGPSASPAARDGDVPEMYEELDFRRDLAALSILGRLSRLRLSLGTRAEARARGGAGAGQGSATVAGGVLSAQNRQLLLALEARLVPFGYGLLGRGARPRAADFAPEAAYFLKDNSFVLNYLPYLSLKDRQGQGILDMGNG
jgi:hypothetical protein